MPQDIEQNLDQSVFDYTIYFTERAGHATEIAKTAIEEGFEIVVAVGGDGSVNEVAAALIGTTVPLGILPGGSGNGFAMHLGWGRNIKKAIQLLNEAKSIQIDTCLLNGRPFVNLAGTGFDALVAYKTKKSTLRGFYGYLKFSLSEAWNYQPQLYTLLVDGQTVAQEEALVIEVANAQMFGYNFVIAPQAKLNDGILDVLLVKKVAKWKYFVNLWRFFNQTFHKSHLVSTFTGKQIIIKSSQSMYVHMDGEGYHLGEELVFEVRPNSLQVLIPVTNSS